MMTTNTTATDGMTIAGTTTTGIVTAGKMTGMTTFSVILWMTSSAIWQVIWTSKSILKLKEEAEAEDAVKVEVVAMATTIIDGTGITETDTITGIIIIVVIGLMAISRMPQLFSPMATGHPT
jgi:hypothetical protein